MCRSKNDPRGFKRCLRHSSASTATVRYTEAKIVSVTRDEIYETLKELNKEGRNLESPSTEEVQQFLVKEKFKAQLDPDLEDKERKLIVKNLEKAAEEVEEQEVTGGAFHAWKNLFDRTLEKMKKPFTVFATSALLVGGLASCTAGEPIPEPTTTPSASVQVLDIGDALGGPLVTDEWGTYQKLVVDPDGIANNFENTVVSLETLEEVGFTIEDAKKAQYVAVRWLVEDIIDNPIIDMPYDRADAEYAKWVAENGSKFYTDGGEWTKDNDPRVVFPEILVRDSTPRLKNLEVKINYITAQTTEKGEKRIIVDADITSTYRVTPEAIKKFYEDGEIDMGEDTKGILDDGSVKLVTLTRTASANITEDDLISGYFFPSFDTRPSLRFENMRTE